MGAWTQLKKTVSRAIFTEAAGILIDDDDPFYRSIASQDPADRNDLTEFSRTQQRRIGRTTYFRHALGGALPDMQVARVLGEGLVYKAKDKPQATDDGEAPESEVQSVIDRFVTDPDNDLEQYLDLMATELLVFGELFLPIFLTPEDGSVRLGYLQPDDIEKIVWAQGDAKRPIAVIQKRPANNYDEPKRMWIIPHPDPAFEGRFPPHPVYGQQEGMEGHIVKGDDGLPVLVPDDPNIQAALTKDNSPVKVAGYLFYHRGHCLLTGRGRSIYERSNDWLKAFDDWLFGVARNAVLQASFVWHVTIKGASASDLEKKRREKQYSQPPRPGSILLTNEQETWEPQSPNLPSAAEVNELRNGMIALIGVSCGLPGHELGATGDSNRSTAKEARSISINQAKRFQRQIGAMVTTWLGYQIDQKIYAGQLDASVDRGVECQFPELDARDDADVATAISQAATAMTLAVQNGLVLKKDGRSYLYGLMGTDLPSEADFEAQDQEQQEQQVAQQQDRLQGIIQQLGGGPNGAASAGANGANGNGSAAAAHGRGMAGTGG